jgi:hypothetical protein
LCIIFVLLLDFIKYTRYWVDRFRWKEVDVGSESESEEDDAVKGADGKTGQATSQ